MEMRKLDGQDLFPIIKILGKLGIAEDLKSIFGGKYQGENEEEIGKEVIFDIIERALIKLENIKDELNKLLASLINKEIEDIKKLDIVEYTQLVVDFFKKEELKGFLTVLLSLMK